MMPAFSARTVLMRLDRPKHSDCLHSAVCIGYPAGISSPYRSLVQAEYFHDSPAHTSPLLPHPMSALESSVGFHLFGLLISTLGLGDLPTLPGRVTYLFLAGSSLRQEREIGQVLVEITWRLQLVATSYRYWGQLGSPHLIHAPWTLWSTHKGRLTSISTHWGQSQTTFREWQTFSVKWMSQAGPEESSGGKAIQSAGGVQPLTAYASACWQSRDGAGTPGNRACTWELSGVARFDQTAEDLQ